MKHLLSIISIILCVLVSTATAQNNFFGSAHLGTDQTIERADFGGFLTRAESFDVYHIIGYASNNGAADYLSAGFGANVYIPKSMLFISPDIRLVVAESHQTNHLGQQVESLDTGGAYSLSAGIHFNKNVFLATGVEYFMVAEDNLSFNPILVKLGF